MIFAPLLSVASQVSLGNDIPTQSYLHIEDRSVSCEHHYKRTDESSNGIKAAQPCNVDDWELLVMGAYPQGALIKDVEGTIRVYGMVSVDGRLTQCARTSLNNPWVLARNVCDRMVEHAKFLPALDESGQPIQSPVSLLVTYVLPQWPADDKVYSRKAQPQDIEKWAAAISRNYPSSPIRRDLNAEVVVRVLVDLRGRVARCEVTKSSGEPIVDRTACRGMGRYARFCPALDEYGSPTLGAYQTKITYKPN